MLDTEVDSLTLPTSMGEITILPHHVPLVANLVAGEIRYKAVGKDDFFAVSSGIIEIKKDGEVVVLADTAEFGHEIDVTQAEAARDAARKMMTQAKDQHLFADASAAFQRELSRLKVARKHHSHKGAKIDSN
jgi:F-type H+-transporting ATPase subunit epsilon